MQCFRIFANTKIRDIIFRKQREFFTFSDGETAAFEVRPRKEENKGI